MARALPQPVRVYRVGGSVRDELLGRPDADRDFVVVGATPEWMLASGYRPVGRDFPVFLHPDTHEEYALARTERKHGRGYRGFEFFASPDVTLEQDLERRDLTINAMARGDDGVLVDPHGGAADLAARRAAPRVRGVRRGSAARAARRALRGAVRLRGRARDRGADAADRGVRRARDAGARSASGRKSRAACRKRGRRGCSPCCATAGRSTRCCPKWPRSTVCRSRRPIIPRWTRACTSRSRSTGRPRADYSLEARYAILAHDLGKADSPADALPRHHAHEQRSVRRARRLSERLRVPIECRDAAALAARWHGVVHRAAELRPATLLDVLSAADALRRPGRLDTLLDACAADACSRPGAPQDYPPAALLRRALAVVKAVDAGAIARAAKDRRRS